jgi:hypothetical protein
MLRLGGGPADRTMRATNIDFRNSLLFAMAIGVTLIAGAAFAADNAPTLDVRPSCRAAATMGGVGGRTFESCMQSEQSARDQLVQQWTTFAASDRNQCRDSATGFEPTYTELLTCLEMARNARTDAAKPKQ